MGRRPKNKSKVLIGKREVDKSADLKSWAANSSHFSERNQDVFGYFSKYLFRLPAY